MIPNDILWVRTVLGQSSLALLPNAPRGVADRLDVLGNRVQKPQQLLNGDSQGTYITNPSYSINTSGIGRPSSAPLVTKYPDQLNDTGGKFNMLDWGAARASRSKCPAFNGYCAGFTAVVLAILVSKNSQLPITTRVEQFKSGEAKTGHTYTVLDRDLASTENNPATWGNGCVAVDPWYGLQTDTDPVKEVSNLADAPFFVALGNWGNIQSMQTFTVGDRKLPVKLP